VVVTAVAWAIFARLYWIDERYTEGLDDQVRSTLAQKEFQKVFCSPEKIDSISLQKSLKDISTVLTHPVYNPKKIQEICDLNERRLAEQTLVDAAAAEGISLAIDSTQEATELGRFGAFPTKRTLEVHWSGKVDDLIEFKLTSVKIKPPDRGYRNEILTDENSETTPQPEETTAEVSLTVVEPA
jgi:hypothetical protein